MDINTDAKQEVERLLRQGEKVAAFEYMRSTFGVSVREARVLVKAVEREMRFARIQMARDIDPKIRTKLVELLKIGRKDEAAVLAKLRLNISITHALAIVNTIGKEVDPNYTPAGGCFVRVLKTMAVTFMLVSLVLFGMAGLSWHQHEQTIENGERTTGQVIDFRYSDASAAPAVLYEWQGEKKVFYSSTYTDPPAHAIDERVPIIVNTLDPAEVLIDTFTDRWLSIVMWTGIGLVFGVFSALFVFLKRKF